MHRYVTTGITAGVFAFGLSVSGQAFETQIETKIALQDRPLYAMGRREEEEPAAEPGFEETEPGVNEGIEEPAEGGGGVPGGVGEEEDLGTVEPEPEIQEGPIEEPGLEETEPGDTGGGGLPGGAGEEEDMGTTPETDPLSSPDAGAGEPDAPTGGY